MERSRVLALGATRDLGRQPSQMMAMLVPERCDRPRDRLTNASMPHVVAFYIAFAGEGAVVPPHHDASRSESVAASSTNLAAFITVTLPRSSRIHPRFAHARSCLLVLSRDLPTIWLMSR